MIYVVIDTNVLVSALLAKNDDVATVQILKKMIMGEIIPVYSQEIIFEYKDVLNRKKFNFSKHLIDYFIDYIKKYIYFSKPKKINIDIINKKDLPFYEVNKNKKDKERYLVTGNIKHFPKEPFIVTPRELIDILNL